jgi:acyl dehydratase
LSILTSAAGESLPSLQKPPVTREQLQRYADASGDHNPIHLDDEVARRVGLDGVIAHGMLSMAFLGQFITQQLQPIPDAYITYLHVRFNSMVRPGDVLTCLGTVQERAQEEAGRERVSITCRIENQRGDAVTSGEAIVSLPLRS